MSRYLIVNGDSRRLPVDLSRVDAVVSDPPYGIGYFRHSNSGAPPKGRGSCSRLVMPRIHDDDRPFDPTPWLDRPCLFWGANHCTLSLPPHGSWLVWDKAAGGGPDDNYADAEFAWTSVRAVKRNVFRYTWKGVCQAGEKDQRRVHPTQKPVALMRWCVRLMNLPPNSVILDPYMGSGTTLIAALAEGHRAIGIEIDHRYCEVARRRIERPHAPVVRPRADEVLPLFAGSSSTATDETIPAQR